MTELATFTSMASLLRITLRPLKFAVTPHNFFDVQMIGEIAAAYAALDANESCRAIVLAAQGKSFCAGAKSRRYGCVGRRRHARCKHIEFVIVRPYDYSEPVKPIVALRFRGPQIGGGLGTRVSADFRVTCAERHQCELHAPWFSFRDSDLP